jgi:hypothetical protein
VLLQRFLPQAGELTWDSTSSMAPITSTSCHSERKLLPIRSATVCMATAPVME